MGYEDYDGWGWRPYVTVAERRRKAAREMEKRKKKGHAVSPVIIEGRAIVKTFWGKSWCENLERYSDYANRLPRGRTYVRNGSVVDLQITPGAIHAWVSGSELYEISLTVAPVAKPRWKSICDDCAGAIDSLVELLQGRFSKGVMERICRQNHGLFPTPAEIELSCSCPDWADMCKHVAAVLYGIGARLDHQPELLFRLRAVDERDLIVKAGEALPLAKQAPAASRVLGGDLSDIFGLDMGPSSAPKLPKKKARAAKKSAVAQKSKPKPKQAASKQRQKHSKGLAAAAGKSST
jgi:uncharacterized Zn finger protein